VEYERKLKKGGGSQVSASEGGLACHAAKIELRDKAQTGTWVAPEGQAVDWPHEANALVGLAVVKHCGAVVRLRQIQTGAKIA
jgi:hypothetical protein